MEEKPKILFVCIGNIIRSPTCEGLLRYLYGDQVLVDSAAISMRDIGKNPTKIAIEICKKNVFDISEHISRLIKKQDFDYFDYIVSLDGHVYTQLMYKMPEKCKAHVIPFAPINIDNPWYGKIDAYEKMYKQIKKFMHIFCSKYLNNLKNIRFQKMISSEI